MSEQKAHGERRELVRRLARAAKPKLPHRQTVFCLPHVVDLNVTHAGLSAHWEGNPCCVLVV